MFEVTMENDQVIVRMSVEQAREVVGAIYNADCEGMAESEAVAIATEITSLIDK